MFVLDFGFAMKMARGEDGWIQGGKESKNEGTYEYKYDR
jgi:hypothetical protein